MQFSNTFISFILLVAPVLAAPSALKTVVKREGEVKPGSYLVTLKPSTDRVAHIESLQLSPESQITHEWDTVFNGIFTEDDLNTLRASDKVDFIEEDGIIKTFANQTNAPWGLARISSGSKLTDQTDTDLTFSYTYDDFAGSGSDVYVIDTGIYTNHTAFGGRARWGATFGGYASQDGNGHGTHVAGTAVSSLYGVAKAANVIAVKVLSDSGSGSTSDVISGINWVATTAPGTGRPSVGSLSVGGSASTTLDNAILALTNAGVSVAVAAGNDGADAANTSPARAPSAITVAASGIDDSKPSWSNYGAVVDIFAPGLDITSTWNDGGTNTISGTSMATPHISGLVAYLYGIDSTLTPDDITSLIKTVALSGVLTSVPSGTANLLIQNNF